MVRTEGKADPHVDERIPGDDTTLHRLLDTGVDRGDVLARDDATLDLVDELVTATGTGGVERDDDVGELTASTRLADVADAGPSRRTA